MKKILLAAVGLWLTAFSVQAQLKEGKIIYERVSQMRARMNINGVENEMPQTRKDNFELNFGNNQSLWKAVEQENDDAVVNNGDGVQMHMIIAGSNDVLYNNFETGKRTEKREVMDKTFIIDDSIRQLKWKLTGETKNILNHNCMKATAVNISKQTRMTVDNGKMERKDVEDTANITAWFATDIPVTAGPAEYQGQLPGLILELDVNNGRQTFKALSIIEKTDLAIIKEPSGKKHYSPAEFRKEREKMMEEMQKNNQGGNRVIRMN